MGLHIENDPELVELAQFETTSRVIASLLNEGLVVAKDGHSPFPSEAGNGVFLQSKTSPEQQGDIWIATSNKNFCSVTSEGRVFHPADFQMPIMMRSKDSVFAAEANPATVMAVLRPLFDIDEVDENAWNQIQSQLENSSRNQVAWFTWAKKQPLPDLSSDALAWEQALVTGHPSHPMHRSCVAQKPLAQMLPSQSPTLLHPQMTLIAVDSAAVKISGPFRSLLKPLLANFALPETRPNEVVLPCLSRQWPIIRETFPSSRVLIEDALQAEAQASIRTVAIPKKYDFGWQLKTALACTITSALRTITPWTACVGPELSAILKDLVPENTWICSEVASLTGAQEDYDQAKMISCVLREDLEPRAESLNQSLIICAALAECPYGSTECYAARTFDLKTDEAKLEWFTDYTSQIINAILAPMLDSGICLEAHGQNMLVRVDKSTKKIAGFAARDLGGVKCHMPTLRSRGYDLTSALPGSFVVTDDEEEAWSIVQHTLIQNHLHHLIRRLRVPRSAAWQMVRNQFTGFFAQRPASERAEKIQAFLFQPTIHNKAFLRMKMQGLYRDYKHTDVPNVLLTL